jgi:hypothetical protein
MPIGKSTLYFVRGTWVFDVDGCIIDSLTMSSLRPGARELLERLQLTGHRVLLWSAGGAEYAHERATVHDVDRFVDAYGEKKGRDADGRYRTDALLADLAGVVFVDDRPEDMPLGADVIAVSPYLSDDRFDRGLAVVARRLG